MTERQRYRERLAGVLDIVPELRAIFLADNTVYVKRKKARSFLSQLLTATFEGNPKIAPLEWIITRDAISVLRRILSARSERLAGFSLVEYINDLLQGKPGTPKPSSGFFAELDHLLRGVTGTTGVYTERLPAFVKYEGAKAARLRSEDLSRMARRAKSLWTGIPADLTTR